MKSIKEKANEHLNSVYAGYDDVLKKLVKESYVYGANYVLEEIEKLVKFNRWAAQDLYKLIEQLKSNQ